MQFPESWLRSFCNPDLSTQQLADLLTMAGLEVEELQPVAPAFTGVVVAQVLEVAKHPDADRLNVCKVDAGTGEVLQIVCGAPNVRPGIKIPCATVGAELPPGADGKVFKIKLGKLRGVESQGMLCSARELGISEESNGLHILAEDAPLGVNIREHLKLDDTLFTLKLTPNLAHCLSVAGIAREVSALTGAPLTLPSIEPVKPGVDAALKVTVQAPELCGRFAGRVIQGVNPKAATPDWMVERLARCGQRSVSALVDISNYVMFELGQPSHVFDLDKIQGELQVRWAQPGETLKLLNGNTVTLDEQVGVIAAGAQVESLAGIMGGDETAVGDDTRNVYLEAAFWWPKAIAGRARRYNFSTDASHRFERGVDPAPTVQYLERITQLILDICGGEPGPLDDQTLSLPQLQPVTGSAVFLAEQAAGCPIWLGRLMQLPMPLKGLQFTITDALVAWQKEIHATLYHGQPLNLPCPLALKATEPTDLNDWCVGFMEGMFMEEDNWYEGDEDLIADLTLPMVVLSDLIDEPELQPLRRDPKLSRELAQQIPDVLTELYLHFHAPKTI